MNLDHVTAELRPRGPWEAADFGVRLMRRDAAAIYRIWFSVTLPMVALVLLDCAYGPYPTLAALAYWWLEPVADGAMLHIISRRLFGEKADVGAALRATPALAWRNWIFLVPPYRFHVARSIAMPLTQLEGVSGGARRARARVLNPKIMSYGTGLTVSYQHLVMALYFGVILIVFAFVPPAYQDTIGVQWITQFWGGGGRGATVLGFLTGYLAQTALQPWFVGAGFGLYINCRTRLEAWDLEIAFRGMVQRRAAAAPATMFLAVAVLATTIMAPRPTSAQELEGDPGFPWFSSDDGIGSALDEVMASEALQTTREVEIWQRIDRQESLPREPSAGLFGKWLSDIGRFLSSIAEFALWIVLAALIYAVVVTAKDWLPMVRAGPSSALSAHRVILVGGEVTAETLPDDIPGEALKLWHGGQKRRALSLLYRGSVFTAVNQHGIRLPPSATENMCISAMEEQAASAHVEFFRKLVTAWIWCAYGSRDPSDDFVASVCAQWPQIYETSP